MVARRKDETDDEFIGRGGITKHLHDAPASQSGGVRTSVPLSFSSSQTQSMIDAAQPGQRNMDGWIRFCLMTFGRQLHADHDRLMKAFSIVGVLATLWIGRLAMLDFLRFLVALLPWARWDK